MEINSPFNDLSSVVFDRYKTSVSVSYELPVWNPSVQSIF